MSIIFRQIQLFYKDHLLLAFGLEVFSIDLDLGLQLRFSLTACELLMATSLLGKKFFGSSKILDLFVNQHIKWAHVSTATEINNTASPTSKTIEITTVLSDIDGLSFTAETGLEYAAVKCALWDCNNCHRLQSPARFEIFVLGKIWIPGGKYPDVLNPITDSKSSVVRQEKSHMITSRKNLLWQ